MDLGIEGRVALVTGAGRGIGRRICLTLAQEGGRVAVNDILEERANDAAEEIAQAGGQAIAVAADVTDAEAVRIMAEQVLQKWDRVDILVNNAGIPLEASYQEPTPGGGPLFRHTDRAFWDRSMDIITYGTLHCTRAVVDGMMRRSGAGLSMSSRTRGASGWQARRSTRWPRQASSGSPKRWQRRWVATRSP